MQTRGEAVADRICNLQKVVSWVACWKVGGRKGIERGGSALHSIFMGNRSL